jgi:signal transduction histidine kinase
MELEYPASLPHRARGAVALVRERAQRNGIALSLEVDPALGEVRATSASSSRSCSTSSPTRSSSRPEGGRIAVDARVNGDGAGVAVSDTGIGIAPEDQAAVFEEFRQVGPRAEGTGLGLALTRKFVELHGGAIGVKSERGRGATFTFTIPQ